MSSVSSTQRIVEPERWLRSHLSAGRHPDGRPLAEHAGLQLQCGTLTTDAAHGSAICTHGGCTVLAAVRGELCTVAPGVDAADERRLRHGRVVVSVEHSESNESTASRHEHSGLPVELAQCQSVLQQLMESDEVVDGRSLLLGLCDRLWWTLYVDLLCIHSTQPIIDTATIALNAALANTRLPTVTVPSVDTLDEADDEPLDVRTLRLAVDTERLAPLAGLTRSRPTAVTFALYGEGKTAASDPVLVLDAGTEHSSVFGAGLTVIAGQGRMLHGVHRVSDSTGAPPQPVAAHVLNRCALAAFERWSEIDRLVDHACRLADASTPASVA